MSGFFAGDDFETFAAVFGLTEFVVNLLDAFFDGIGGGGTDVDLLDLDGRFESAGEVEVDEDGIVEVDTVEVDRVVNFFEDADDHELLAVVVESFSDGLWAAVHFHGCVVAKDGDIFAKRGVEELAVFKWNVDDVEQVGAGGDNVDVFVVAICDSDGGIGNCDWGDSGNVRQVGDGFDVVDGKVRFDVLVGGSEFVDDAASCVFAGARANQDEISVVFVAVGSDEAVDAAGEGKNQNDGCYADGNAERRKKSAATVATKAVDGKVKMSFNEYGHF